MILYIILAVLIVLACLTCFRGKINKGIVVLVTLACLASAVITSVVKTVEYHNSNNSIEWNDTTYITLENNPESWEGQKVFVSKKQKNPVQMNVYHKTKIDVGLLWDILNKAKLVESNLILNPKQYEIYKAYQDSVAQRKDSLESSNRPVWQNK